MDDSTNNKTKPIKKPIIEYFFIEGLYGYKTIGINFEQNVKIVAADNGAGKTTLLHTLYAVLTGNINELKHLDYKQITLKLQDQEEITLFKEKTFSLLTDIERIIQDNEIKDEKKKMILENITDRIYLVERFLKNVKQRRKTHDYYEISIKMLLSEIEEVIREELNLASNTIFRLIEEISILLEQKYHKNKINIFENEVNNDANFFRIIEDFLIENKISIIYQPTFRRIEKQVPGITFNPYETEHFNNRYFLRHNNLIQFGLDDVKRNIDSICEKIRNITLAGYNNLSENILERFLAKDKNSIKDVDRKILINILELFLNRFGKQERKIIEYNRLFEEKYSSEQNGKIVLLLKELVPEFEQWNYLKKKIDLFGSVINSYFKYDSYEEKEFIFDRNRVTAKVINKITSQELNLNSLSSGEKQIFNIFSKLYLENNNDQKYIILFDEPELSLSLDWQKKFLPDIFYSPCCAQLFAITHSPFIFDNELKHYAGSLIIRNLRNEIR